MRDARKRRLRLAEHRRRSTPAAAALLTLVPALVLVLLGTAAPAASQSSDRALELHRAGRLDEALAEYDRIIEAYAEAQPGLAAQAFINSCLIWMNRGDNERALPACREGVRLRRRGDSERRLALGLNNLGLVLQNLGRYEDSGAAFREALEINRRIGEARSAAQNLTNLSGLAIQEGRYARALEEIEAVRELIAAAESAGWGSGQLAVAAINEGVVLEKLGAFRAALASYRRALEQEEEVDPRLEALLQVNMGVVYRNLGDPVRAVDLFDRASATYRRLGDRSGLSNALLNTALARHLNLAQPAAAEAAYREALALSVESGDRPEQIQDLFYLGTLLVERGRTGEAAELFRHSLEVSEASGSAEGRWSSLAGLGRAAAAEGRARDAMEHFERALALIETLRADLAEETYRAHFFGDKRRVYAAALQTAAELHRAEPRGGRDAAAFHLAQRAKARELLDALRQDRAGRPLTHDEIPGTFPLLEYFVAERDLLRWTLAGGELEMANLGPAAPLIARVLRVHRDLAGGQAPAATDLEELASTLLAGVRLPAGGRLRIAPDAALRYLPFELLPLPGAGGELLLDRAAIEYLPSASVLPGLERAGREPALRTLALANPTRAEPGAAPQPAALLAARFGLDDLPAGERELESLERWLGGPALLLAGAEATEAAFRDHTARGAGIVHLATHAVIDERPGRGAAVLLAPADADDGLLYPHEIAAQRSPVDLTVLAACRTAFGSEAGGSSLATLTGAFLAAGSRGVVATLWEVGDGATAAFMEQFYWQLGRGATPAAALQLTKQTLRGDPRWSAPHLWSGYVLFGDAPAVVDPPRRWWLWVGAVLLLAAAVTALLKARGSGTPRYTRGMKAARPLTCLILLTAALSLTGCGPYNRLVELQEAADGAWSQVENAYQRRADLIPNLVATVKGAADFERETLTAVVEARAKVGQVRLDGVPDAEQLAAFQEAQEGLSSALSRLLVVVEQYPELRATQAFRDLQVQLEGTENRISVERRRFNETVQSYNTYRRQFPGTVYASLFSFEDKPYFESRPGSDEPPTVEF